MNVNCNKPQLTFICSIHNLYLHLFIQISALERNQQPTRTDDNLSGKVLDMAMELGQLKERSKDFDTLKTRFDNSERMVRRLKDDNDRKTDSIAKMTMVHEVKCKEYNDTIANMVAVRDQLKEDFNAKLNLLKERCKDFDILKSKFDNAEKVIKLLEIDNCTKQASIAKMLVDHETKCKEYDETIASMTAERVQLTVDFDAKYNVQKENLQIMTKEVQKLKETNNYVNESHRMRGEIDYLEKKLNRKHYNAQQSIADTPVDARNDKVNNGKHKDKEPNERPKRLAKEPSDSKIRLHREHMKWKIKY